MSNDPKEPVFKAGKVQKRRDDQRAKVREALEAVEEDKRRELFKKRLEIVNTGIQAYQKREITEAVQNFQAYIRILESWKGVGEGGLTPANFDKKEEASELLLLNGVYWDLAKLYDRTESPARRVEFQNYLKKYVLFSKNTFHQNLAAESLRKYIRQSRPRHRAEFLAAYREISGSRCFVATALLDLIDESTLERLRLFRDLTLNRSVPGRVLVRVYEKTSPGLATLVIKMPFWFRKPLARLLDQVAGFMNQK